MKLPTIISLSRLVFSGLFLIGFYLPYLLNFPVIARILFLLFTFLSSEISDFLDGYVARKRNITSPLGKLLDPYTDVIAHITFLFCFFSLEIVPTYLILIIIYREFSAIFLRLLFQIFKGITQPARTLGKIKSLLYGLCTFLSFVYYSSLLLKSPFEGIFLESMNIIFIITAFFSIISFLDHLIIYLKSPNKVPQ